VPTNELDGQPLWWATGAGDDTYLYFSQNASASTTLSGLLGGGGIVLERNRANDSAFVDYLLDQLGDRATPINIGQHRGVLTWADPDANGIRTHNLYWFDGAYIQALIADRPAWKLVNIGRDLVCS
jgi:hypothetical protein